MSSSKADYARRTARFYGPQRVQLSRPERIQFCRAQIALLMDRLREQQVVHKASCPECQRGYLCLYPPSSVETERIDKLSFLRGLIRSEEQDEAYAQRARVRPVEYKQHIDGFCSYWQNVRHRKFAAVGWKCERCNKPTSELDAHHLHYDTLGFEELRDLQALCRPCHEHADEERAADTRYDNAMSTYMQKKYGDYWPDDAEEEFDEWWERKQEEQW